MCITREPQLYTVHLTSPTRGNNHKHKGRTKKNTKQQKNTELDSIARVPGVDKYLKRQGEEGGGGGQKIYVYVRMSAYIKKESTRQAKAAAKQTRVEINECRRERYT